MELRRALLLFAIVLGLAAVASSVTRDPQSEDEQAADSAPTTAQTTPSAAPSGGDTPQPTTIEFRAGAKPATHELEPGQPATVLVDVEIPGQVEIPSLGLTAAAEPLTPAMFEVLEHEPGRHRIVTQPAGSETLSSTIGTLAIVARDGR